MRFILDLDANATKNHLHSMPEVLECPPQLAPHIFTSETGRQAAIAKAQLVEDGKRYREQIIEQSRIDALPKPEDPTRAQLEALRQIELCNEQITRTRERLNDDKACWCKECERGGVDDKARAALLRELRGLMEHLCRLHNIAQAPTSKAMPARSRSIQAPPIPQPVVVQPVPQKPVEPVV